MPVTTHPCNTAKARSRFNADLFDARMLVRHNCGTLAAQARLLRVSESTLRRMRGGEISPNVELALRMARAAATPVESLFALPDGMPTQRKAVA